MEGHVTLVPKSSYEEDNIVKQINLNYFKTATFYFLPQLQPHSPLTAFLIALLLLI